MSALELSPWAALALIIAGFGLCSVAVAASQWYSELPPRSNVPTNRSYFVPCRKCDNRKLSQIGRRTRELSDRAVRALTRVRRRGATWWSGRGNA